MHDILSPEGSWRSLLVIQGKYIHWDQDFFSFLPLRLKAQRGIAIMVAGGRSACAMSVVPHFFVKFFSYDPEISHECSPP